jgi:hypothetical protein
MKQQLLLGCVNSRICSVKKCKEVRTTNVPPHSIKPFSTAKLRLSDLGGHDAKDQLQRASPLCASDRKKISPEIWIRAAKAP